jgi:hypothetical protein
VEEQIRQKMEVVKERMREREQAVQKNEGVDRELVNLKEARNVERRVADMMIKKSRERRGGIDED